MAYTFGYFVVFNDLALPTRIYRSNLGQFIVVQLLLCTTFLGGHVWHAFKSKEEYGVLQDKDKFGAILVGFIVLAIAAICLALLSNFKGV